MASGDYAPTVIDGVQCVWLQGIGWHKAKPLGDVTVGDVLVYNYGGTARVDSITRTPSGRSVVLVVTAGKQYTCNPRRVTTLVAVK